MTELNDLNLFDFEDSLLFEPSPEESNVLSILKKCSLLEDLSAQDSLGMLREGELHTVQAGSFETPLGFLNIVLEGTVCVERSSLDQQYSSILKVGDFFGPIDSIMRGDQFRSWRVVNSARLFSLGKGKFSEFFRNYKALKDKVTRLRSQEALKQAKKYEEATGGKFRVAPRLSVIDRNLAVSYNDQVFKVLDVSASGLGLLGQAPEALGAQMNVLFECSNLDMSAMALATRVSRTSSEAFGLKLLDLDPQTKLHWEEVILRVMHVHIDEDFEPDLTPLAKTHEVQFESLGFYYQGRMDHIGIEGGLLQTDHPLGSEKITLTFPIQEEGHGENILFLASRVVGRRNDGYLLEFLNLEERTQENLLRYLQMQSGLSLPSDEELNLNGSQVAIEAAPLVEQLPTPTLTDEATKPISTGAEAIEWPVLRFRSPQDFLSQYVFEFEKGTTFLATKVKFNLGQSIHLLLDVQTQFKTPVERVLIKAKVAQNSHHHAQVKFESDDNLGWQRLRELAQEAAYCAAKLDILNHKRRRLVRALFAGLVLALLLYLAYLSYPKLLAAL